MSKQGMGVWLLLPKDDQSVGWVCLKHRLFVLSQNPWCVLMNGQNFTRLQSCRASTAAAPSWSIHAMVQVTLKNINYSQHIRHDWLPSFGPILSSQYLLTCAEGVLGSGVMSPPCGHSGAKLSRLFKLVSSFIVYTLLHIKGPLCKISFVKLLS